MPDPDRVAYLTQTTLAVDETAAVVDRLRERFPSVVGPRADDICYATQNRQQAVRELVAPSRPGARRRLGQLVELATASSRSPAATASPPTSSRTRRRSTWRGSPASAASAITAGASAPEHLVQRVVERARQPRAGSRVAEHAVVDEDVQFTLPVEVR